MGRIGSALALLLAAPALGEVEFYQRADRSQVGTEDTFRLDVVVGDAGNDLQVTLPSSPDFEVLSKSQSTQMSYSLGSGGAGVIKRVQRWTLTVRANRPGSLTIPPSVLTTGGKTYKTESVKVDVVKGRTGPDPAQQRQQRPTIQTPFGPMPGFPGMDDDDDPFGMFPTPQVPTGDSDLFLRASLDKEEAYVGEQVTLTIVVFSRVDLAEVGNPTLPKLDGFWSEDLESSTRLVPENRDVNGVAYRAYPILRRALFAVKPGALAIGAAEADITTGYLFAGHRVHRRSNPLSLKVKPLPPGGNTSVVGNWRLSVEASQTKVAVGEPVQVKVTLEGKGNLKNTSPPALKGPAALKIYDPTTTDKVLVTRGRLGGRRTQEYVVVPQQTGAFRLEPLVLQYFDPDTGRYEETRTDPLDLQVTAGAGGAQVVAVPGPSAFDPGLKNRLEATGLRPLRHTARFAAPTPPLRAQPWFWGVALAPLGLAAGLGLYGAVRGMLARSSPEARRRQLGRDARRRLGAAEKLAKTGKPADFYAEVEKAVTAFLEARVGEPVTGMTRDQLDARLQSAGAGDEVRRAVRAVLDTCDMGRFAPGMGEAAARRKALDDAAAAMGAWEAK